MKKMKALYLIIILLSLSLGSTAQSNNTQPLRPEDLSDDEIDMNRPTFEPKVRMGKVLDGKDSIPYVELNNVYVYPEPTFTDPRQRAAYNRLVRNVKKVLPIAKEVNRIIVETYDYLQTLPNKKAKELRAKDEAALKQELIDLQNAHFKLRMQKATQQLTNTASLRTTRRDIARVRTILTQKATTK